MELQECTSRRIARLHSMLTVSVLRSHPFSTRPRRKGFSLSLRISKLKAGVGGLAFNVETQNGFEEGEEGGS